MGAKLGKTGAVGKASVRIVKNSVRIGEKWVKNASLCELVGGSTRARVR